MPRWPQAPDTEEKIQLTTKAWNLGYYKSKEACAAAREIDPNTFRRRPDGSIKSPTPTNIVYLPLVRIR